MPVCLSMRPAHASRVFAALVPLVCAVLSTVACSQAARASCPSVRPQDQLWLVSSRGLGCDIEQQAPRMACWRYDPEARWVHADLDALLAADAGHLVTTIFVHGNRMSHAAAFTRGWQAYRALIRSADERPVRFIIWSWPSAQIDGPLQDVRVKARRTNPAGCYLAWFVHRLPPQAPLSLWGHSFGARVVTGALHILGGGAIGGYCLSEPEAPPRQPANVVLVTAALDNDWLVPGHFHGCALSQVGHMLLVNNGCDRLLKRYHWLYHRKDCSQALGFSGLPRCALGCASCTEQVDACCQIGPEHSLALYLCSRNLMARMRNCLVLTLPEVDAAPETVTGDRSTDAAAGDADVDDGDADADDSAAEPVDNGPELPAIP